MRPLALRVRSGDIMVLAGQARRCYHGEGEGGDDDEWLWMDRSDEESVGESLVFI